MGAIGSAVSGVGALGSALGGKGAAGGQPFIGTGGVTPQQADLAQYSYGQNLLKDAQEFAGSGQGGGTGMSTMSTQAAGGSAFQQALDLSGMSQTDESAQYKAQQVAGQYAQQNVNALTSLAGLAGKALGPSSSGNTGGAAAAASTT